MATTIKMAHAEALVARRLDPQRLLEKFGVHSGQNAGGDFLAIPYFRDGAIKNNKYRRSLIPGEGGGESWQDGRKKNAIRLLYNEDALRRTDLKGMPVIITEGEPDLWALDAAGYERIVGWPDGAPEESIPLGTDSPKYAPLEDAMPLFGPDNLGSPETPIILAVDGDEPGIVLMHDLSLRLGRARCKFLTYPKSKKDRGRERCKDLGEVLEDYGPSGVVKTIERAQFIHVPGVYRMSQLAPRPTPVAFDVGMPHLRNSLKLRLGDFSVWTGIPSMGKTTLVNDVVCRIVDAYSSDDEPFKAAFASFEQDPQVDHRRNLRTWVQQKPPHKQSDVELASSDMWIDQHFVFLVPSEDDDVTLDWVLEKMGVAVVQHGVKIVVVDPWNEMDHDRAPGESVTEYTGRAIKAFRRAAKKLNIHLAVVAHPTKMAVGADGKFQKPTLYNISDSAHWYNKADVGIVVHQEDGLSIIDVQKSRYHDEIGRPATYEAVFHPSEKRFDVSGVRSKH